MKTYQGSEIRNVAVVGHAHSGKTTLIAALLHAAKMTPTQGRVEDGTAVTAYDEEEVARGATMQNAVAFVEWNGVKINLVDTPGFHMFSHEARAALLAVKEIKDIFTIVSMTYEKDGHTLNGTDPVTALITLQNLGANAVGCNCSTGPEKMVDFIAAMKPYEKVPLVAKPNAGVPHLEDGKTIFEMDAKTFASFGRKLAIAGANMLGGCCGTTPAHIQKLAQKIKGIKPHDAYKGKGLRYAGELIRLKPGKAGKAIGK